MKPIEILKRGLLKLRNQVQQWKSELEAKLKAGQPVSDADVDWLDGDGNLIDEEWVVEILDNASQGTWWSICMWIGLNVGLIWEEDPASWDAE